MDKSATAKSASDADTEQKKAAGAGGSAEPNTDAEKKDKAGRKDDAKGKVVIEVMVIGVYFDTYDSFASLVLPKLDAIVNELN